MPGRKGSKPTRQVVGEVVVIPFGDPNIGRRTGIDVTAGKNIRKNKHGLEDFDDYWTDSDSGETEDSMALWRSMKENNQSHGNKSLDPSTNFKVDSPVAHMSPFSSADSGSFVVRTLARTEKTLPISKLAIPEKEPEPAGHKSPNKHEEENQAEDENQSSTSDPVNSDDNQHDQEELPESNEATTGQTFEDNVERSQEEDNITPVEEAAPAGPKLHRVGDVEGTISRPEDAKPDTKPPDSVLQNFRTRKRLTYSSGLEESHPTGRESLSSQGTKGDSSNKLGDDGFKLPAGLPRKSTKGRSSDPPQKTTSSDDKNSEKSEHVAQTNDRNNKNQAAKNEENQDKNSAPSVEELTDNAKAIDQVLPNKNSRAKEVLPTVSQPADKRSVESESSESKTRPDADEPEILASKRSSRSLKAKVSAGRNTSRRTRSQSNQGCRVSLDAEPVVLINRLDVDALSAKLNVVVSATQNNGEEHEKQQDLPPQNPKPDFNKRDSNIHVDLEKEEPVEDSATSRRVTRNSASQAEQEKLLPVRRTRNAKKKKVEEKTEVLPPVQTKGRRKANLNSTYVETKPSTERDDESKETRTTRGTRRGRKQNGKCTEEVDAKTGSQDEEDADLPEKEIISDTCKLVELNKEQTARPKEEATDTGGESKENKMTRGKGRGRKQTVKHIEDVDTNTGSQDEEETDLPEKEIISDTCKLVELNKEQTAHHEEAASDTNGEGKETKSTRGKGRGQKQTVKHIKEVDTKTGNEDEEETDLPEKEIISDELMEYNKEQTAHHEEAATDTNGEGKETKSTREKGRSRKQTVKYIKEVDTKTGNEDEEETDLPEKETISDELMEYNKEQTAHHEEAATDTNVEGKETKMTREEGRSRKQTVKHIKEVDTKTGNEDEEETDLPEKETISDELMEYNKEQTAHHQEAATDTNVEGKETKMTREKGRSRKQTVKHIEQIDTNTGTQDVEETDLPEKETISDELMEYNKEQTAHHEEAATDTNGEGKETKSTKGKGRGQKQTVKHIETGSEDKEEADLPEKEITCDKLLEFIIEQATCHEEVATENVESKTNFEMQGSEENEGILENNDALPSEKVDYIEQSDKEIDPTSSNEHVREKSNATFNKDAEVDDIKDVRDKMDKGIDENLLEQEVQDHDASFESEKALSKKETGPCEKLSDEVVITDCANTVSSASVKPSVEFGTQRDPDQLDRDQDSVGEDHFDEYLSKNVHEVQVEASCAKVTASNDIIQDRAISSFEILPKPGDWSLNKSEQDNNENSLDELNRNTPDRVKALVVQLDTGEKLTVEIADFDTEDSCPESDKIIHDQHDVAADLSLENDEIHLALDPSTSHEQTDIAQIQQKSENSNDNGKDHSPLAHDMCTRNHCGGNLEDNNVDRLSVDKDSAIDMDKNSDNCFEAKEVEKECCDSMEEEISFVTLYKPRPRPFSLTTVIEEDDDFEIVTESSIHISKSSLSHSASKKRLSRKMDAEAGLSAEEKSSSPLKKYTEKKKAVDSDISIYGKMKKNDASKKIANKSHSHKDEKLKSPVKRNTPKKRLSQKINEESDSSTDGELNGELKRSTSKKMATQSHPSTDGKVKRTLKSKTYKKMAEESDISMDEDLKSPSNKSASKKKNNGSDSSVNQKVKHALKKSTSKNEATESDSSIDGNSKCDSMEEPDEDLKSPTNKSASKKKNNGSDSSINRKVKRALKKSTSKNEATESDSSIDGNSKCDSMEEPDDNLKSPTNKSASKKKNNGSDSSVNRKVKRALKKSTSKNEAIESDSSIDGNSKCDTMEEPMNLTSSEELQEVSNPHNGIPETNVQQACSADSNVASTRGVKKHHKLITTPTSVNSDKKSEGISSKVACNRAPVKKLFHGKVSSGGEMISPSPVKKKRRKIKKITPNFGRRTHNRRKQNVISRDKSDSIFHEDQALEECSSVSKKQKKSRKKQLSKTNRNSDIEKDRSHRRDSIDLESPEHNNENSSPEHGNIQENLTQQRESSPELSSKSQPKTLQPRGRGRPKKITSIIKSKKNEGRTKHSSSIDLESPEHNNENSSPEHGNIQENFIAESVPVTQQRESSPELSSKSQPKTLQPRGRGRPKKITSIIKSKKNEGRTKHSCSNDSEDTIHSCETGEKRNSSVEYVRQIKQKKLSRSNSGTLPAVAPLPHPIASSIRRTLAQEDCPTPPTITKRRKTRHIVPDLLESFTDQCTPGSASSQKSIQVEDDGDVDSDLSPPGISAVLTAVVKKKRVRRGPSLMRLDDSSPVPATTETEAEKSPLQSKQSNVSAHPAKLQSILKRKNMQTRLCLTPGPPSSDQASDSPAHGLQKEVRIIEPAVCTDGMRRSSRTRVKPLDWFRRERIKYQKRKSGGFVIAGIESPQAKERRLKDKTKKKRVYHRKIPATPRNLSVHEEVPSDFELAESQDIPVMDPTTGEEVLVDCVRTQRSLAFRGPTGLEAQPSDHLILCKSLVQPSFCAGDLIIRPSQKKNMQIVRNDSMVFRIIRGKIAVTIHRTTSILETGDSFFVPQGNAYSIINLRKDEAKLHFFQLRH